MNIITYTSIGLRSRNEDFLLSEQLTPDISFHIIADGMGGYSHGDKAARIVVETLFGQISQMDFYTISEETIIAACERANLNLRDEGAKLSSKIGATFAAVLVLKEKVFAFWMGDTRIYQYNENNQLLFQSEDHSLVNELRSARKLSMREIEKYDSIVTRCLTSDFQDVSPQIEVLRYTFSDKLIICSDGLYKQINLDAVLGKNKNDLMSYLYSIENEMNDNYSIIIIN